MMKRAFPILLTIAFFGIQSTTFAQAKKERKEETKTVKAIDKAAHTVEKETVKAAKVVEKEALKAAEVVERETVKAAKVVEKEALKAAKAVEKSFESDKKAKTSPRKED